MSEELTPNEASLIDDAEQHGRYFSPVAEHLDVCIIERGGDIPKTWEGRDYKTDGLTYLARLVGDQINLIKFSSERLAKDYIESTPYANRKSLVSMMQFWTLIKKPVPAIPKYRWDEAKNGFVVIDGAVDGLSRMAGARGLL